MKDRQYNDKKEKVKWNKLIHEKLHRKDRSTRTPHKTARELRCNGRVSSSCFVGDIHRITFKRYKHHLFQTVMLTKFYIMYQ